jgi:multidrug resistance efflux pump
MKPIPTPVPERWRQVRLTVLPAIVFVGALLAMAILWADRMGIIAGVGPNGGQVVPVSSYRAGVLTSVTVTRFQKVRQGDPLGYVLVADPKLLKTTVAALQVDLRKLSADIEAQAGDPQPQDAMDYARLRLDWMQQRVELATAKVELQLIETKVRRMEQRFRDGLGAASELDTAHTKQEDLRRQVEELAKRAAAGARALTSLQNAGAAKFAEMEKGGVFMAISVLEARLRQVESELSPMLLRAPIDGTITDINYRSGEVVAPGLPIILIAADHPIRTAGFSPSSATATLEASPRVRPRTAGVQTDLGVVSLR